MNQYRREPAQPSRAVRGRGTEQGSKRAPCVIAQKARSIAPRPRSGRGEGVRVGSEGRETMPHPRSLCAIARIFSVVFQLRPVPRVLSFFSITEIVSFDCPMPSG
jgi:hypothetical protein